MNTAVEGCVERRQAPNFVKGKERPSFVRHLIHVVWRICFGVRKSGVLQTKDAQSLDARTLLPYISVVIGKHRMYTLTQRVLCALCACWLAQNASRGALSMDIGFYSSGVSGSGAALGGAHWPLAISLRAALEM